MKTNCPITKFLTANPISRLRSFQNDPFDFFDSHLPIDTSKPVATNIGFRKLFICYDPVHAQHILQDKKSRYDKSSLVLKKIRALSGPRGLIQLEGDDAKRVRNTSASLMNSEGMDRLAEKVDAFIADLYPVIEKAIQRNKAVDLVPHLTRLVLRTAGVFVLNHDLANESDKLNAAFVDLNRNAGKSLKKLVECPFSPGRRKSLNTIHSELNRIGEEVLSELEPSLMRSLKIRGEEEEFIHDQLKAFLFAGYDTTASSLIFAAYLVANDPAAQQKIALEGRSRKDSTYESLRKSVYVQSAYKEALRLYPSAYFLPRETNQDDLLGGVKIPRRSQVFLSVRHIQRHPSYFETPNAFVPDRFLTELKHPFSFLPFGGGPRVCIGAALAKLEATLVLQKLCQRYVMRPANSAPPEIEAMITAHTTAPLQIFFQARPERSTTPEVQP